MSVFRQRLVEAISRTGKSANQIAADAGISHFAIYSYLREERIPNAFTLCCLADVLGVSMDWLFGRNPGRIK